MTIWPWLLVSSVAYVLMAKCVVWALRPKAGTWQPYPDWFWGGDVNEGHWVRQEPIDQPASKPTSGAG